MYARVPPLATGGLERVVPFSPFPRPSAPCARLGVPLGAPMAALDGAIAKVDALLSTLDAGLTDRSAVPPLRVDPDDPWADTINPPVGVHKVRCVRCASGCVRGRVVGRRAAAADG